MTSLAHKVKTVVTNPKGVLVMLLFNSRVYVMLAQILQFGVGLGAKVKKSPPIIDCTVPDTTAVESFWSKHTTAHPRLLITRTRKQDETFLKWRSDKYPMFQELMGLWGDHTGEVVLDYGCGPGTDIIGFLLHSNPSKVIGIDISKKALWFARRRIALHNIPLDKVELIRISDSVPTIPLESDSIDFIYTQGVLHHTSYPEKILAELYRVLKPHGKASVMVYNRESVWFHLYVAYEQMILQGNYKGLTTEQAFALTTDSKDCPISRCYKPQKFLALCQAAGFSGEYAGGYYSLLELEMVEKYIRAAINDCRLGEEHRQFLSELNRSPLPKRNDKLSGVGGVYRIEKT